MNSEGTTPRGRGRPTTKTPEEQTPKFKRCRICWGRYKGFGLSNGHERKNKIYFKCRRHFDEHGVKQDGGCGMTWSVTFSPQEVLRIEYREALREACEAMAARLGEV